MRSTIRTHSGGEGEAEAGRKLRTRAQRQPARSHSRPLAFPTHDSEEAKAGCDILEGYHLLQNQLIGLPTTLLLLLALAQQGKLDEALAAGPPAPAPGLEQRLVVLKALLQEWDTPQGMTHARLLRAQARSALGDIQLTRRFLRAASDAFKKAASAGTSLLPAEEQDAVLRLVGQGEGQIQRGAHWLVVNHLWLVKTLAASCRRLGVPEGDLPDVMQEGCMGLLAAADLFDGRKGTHFRTYATPWVRQAVGRYLRSRRVVSPPRALQQTANKLRRQARHLEQLLARDISTEELAASAGVLPHEVSEAFAAQHADLSLDTPVGDGLTLGDVLADPAASAFFDGTASETTSEDGTEEPDRTHATGPRGDGE